jgi:hypothetical protein
VNKFCDQELGEIRTPENEEYIFYILKNLQNYTEKGHQILERKAKTNISICLEDCDLEFGTNDRTIVSRISRLRSTTLFDPPDYSNSIGTIIIIIIIIIDVEKEILLHLLHHRHLQHHLHLRQEQQKYLHLRHLRHLRQQEQYHHHRQDRQEQYRQERQSSNIRPLLKL